MDEMDAHTHTPTHPQQPHHHPQASNMAVLGGSKRKSHVSPTKGKSKKTKGVGGTTIAKQTTIFLKNLRRNNNKEWMKEHKAGAFPWGFD
jgi:hypothetical protein